jgi:hypothetical protein
MDYVWLGLQLDIPLHFPTYVKGKVLVKLDCCAIMAWDHMNARMTQDAKTIYMMWHEEHLWKATVLQ